MTKKVVSSSHLALRFYKTAGWDRATLEKYLLKGKLLDTGETHGDSNGMAYFILEIGAAFDMDRLYADQVSVVERFYGDKPTDNDLEYMKAMNW